MIPVTNAIEVRGRVWNVSRPSMEVRCCVRHCINMVAVRDEVSMRCRVRNEISLRIPRCSRTKGRVRHSVDVGCRVRNGVNMIAVANVVSVCCRVWHVMEMSVVIEALSACHLSHSKNCYGGDYDCARFQHCILPNRIVIFFHELPGGRSFVAQSFGLLITESAYFVP